MRLVPELTLQKVLPLLSQFLMTLRCAVLQPWQQLTTAKSSFMRFLLKVLKMQAVSLMLNRSVLLTDCLLAFQEKVTHLQSLRNSDFLIIFSLTHQKDLTRKMYILKISYLTLSMQEFLLRRSRLRLKAIRLRLPLLKKSFRLRMKGLMKELTTLSVRPMNRLLPS